MIRSMSDEQMLAKYRYDKEPWAIVMMNGSTGSVRFTNGAKMHFGFQTRFAPRPECIPSPDPLPFVNPNIPRNEGVPVGMRYSYPVNFKYGNGRSYYRPRPWGEFTPDSEFVRSEVNPILSQFRDWYDKDEPTPYVEFLKLWAEGAGEIITEATPEQVEQASKVLSRLRDVMEASK